MATQKLISVLLLQLLIVLLASDFSNGQKLKVGFYQKTCPNIGAIVAKTTRHYISRAPTLAAPLLRLHFHDCFVRGCDGSVLLNSTASNSAEKEAVPNQSLKGFHVIDAVKSAVEKKCPGVVSCADILALVARDAVRMLHGSFWEVPTGRRDGRVSVQSEALNELPSAHANITQLKATFALKGLTVKDLVVLSGGHTIGRSPCRPFLNRLYNFTGKRDTDPKLDKNYIAQLKTKCKEGDTKTRVEMDPGSFKTFDEHYYTLVTKRKGLFESDSALLDDPVTRAYVIQQATSHGATFLKDFGPSMVKMGNIGVLTGNSGEIRKQCAFVN